MPVKQLIQNLAEETASHEMTDEELDEHFRQLVDSFIDQANNLVKGSNAQNVGLALLHAASRFNAFVVSTQAPTLAEYNRDLYRAREFFKAQYEEMLDQNLADYKNIYK
jgi:hypothetical protein